jgi:hypothetical protein
MRNKKNVPFNMFGMALGGPKDLNVRFWHGGMVQAWVAQKLFNMRVTSCIERLNAKIKAEEHRANFLAIKR